MAVAWSGAGASCCSTLAPFNAAHKIIKTKVKKSKKNK